MTVSDHPIIKTLMARLPSPVFAALWTTVIRKYGWDGVELQATRMRWYMAGREKP